MGVARVLSTLLPHLNGVRIETCSLSEQGVTVTVASGRGSAPCPVCHRRSRRIHARFIRTLADLPWDGQVVQIRLRGRRLRCTNRRCPRHTFRERVPQLALPSRRRTHALPARPRPPLAPHAVRWLLVKPPDAVTDDEHPTLARLFEAYPRVKTAHTARAGLPPSAARAPT